MCVTSTIFAVIAGLSMVLNVYLMTKTKKNDPEPIWRDEEPEIDEIDISVYEGD